MAAVRLNPLQLAPIRRGGPSNRIRKSWSRVVFPSAPRARRSGLSRKGRPSETTPERRARSHLNSIKSARFGLPAGHEEEQFIDPRGPASCLTTRSSGFARIWLASCVLRWIQRGMVEPPQNGKRKVDARPFGAGSRLFAGVLVKVRWKQDDSVLIP